MPANAMAAATAAVTIARGSRFRIGDWREGMDASPSLRSVVRFGR
jgi:hypothetical protein